MFFFSSSVSFPLLTLTDHKKTYGEEHGSCQAGIAGVFTEVSRSTSLLCVFTCVALRWLDYMYEHRHITVCDWYIHSPGFTQICLIIYSPNLWCFEHKWRIPNLLFPSVAIKTNKSSLYTLMCFWIFSICICICAYVNDSRVGWESRLTIANIRLQKSYNWMHKSYAQSTLLHLWSDFVLFGGWQLLVTICFYWMGKSS